MYPRLTVRAMGRVNRNLGLLAVHFQVKVRTGLYKWPCTLGGKYICSAR
jgi:hypothetical protein